MAPETGTSSQNGMLGSIASSFGVDLSNMESSDAITPLIYPELLEDNRFIAELFAIKLKSRDGKIDTNLYTYAKEYQEYPWWSKCAAWVKVMLTPKEKEFAAKGNKYDPYVLSKTENDIIESIRGSLKVSVDKKTGVITSNYRGKISSTRTGVAMRQLGAQKSRRCNGFVYKLISRTPE